MRKTDKAPVYRLFFPLEVRKSIIAGKGAFAAGTIPPRKKIGDLGGVIISERAGRQLAKTMKSIALVEFGNGKSLNASENSNELRYVNHSCDPNTYMRVTHNRVEFYALRNIRKNEELTCDYGETHHEGKLPCRCGAANCKGKI
ncbi:MAG: SET domain-containing protein [Chitinophagaceae bacterium]